MRTVAHTHQAPCCFTCMLPCCMRDTAQRLLRKSRNNRQVNHLDCPSPMGLRGSTGRNQSGYQSNQPKRPRRLLPISEKHRTAMIATPTTTRTNTHHRQHPISGHSPRSEQNISLRRPRHSTHPSKRSISPLRTLFRLWMPLCTPRQDCTAWICSVLEGG